ncbi:MAG: ComEA family DNA-binding protein [Armatimonadota bacterium]
MADLTRTQLIIVAVCLAAIVVAGSWIAWSKVRQVPAPSEDEFFAGQPVAAPPAPPLVVYVSGQVLRPGLYELPQGARAGDAVAAAGGYTAAADVERINLAAPLQDGDQVHIPARQMAASPDAAGAVAPARAGRVSINHGTFEELQRLPGVGPEIARRIVEYRQSHGYFRSLEQLKEVSGIGDKKLEQMRPMLTL